MRVRHSLVLVALAVVGACVRTPDASEPPAQPTQASSEPRPVAVLLRHSVWFGAVNLPLFILYEDGRVIIPARLEQGVPSSYRTARIDFRDPDAALARLGIGPGFFQLQPTYDFRPNVTDQETVFLLVWRGDSLVRVSLRAAFEGEGRFVDGVPEAFRAAYTGITTFQPDDAVDWQPDTLEVSAW